MTKCKKCGQSLKKLMLLAMLEDLGCTVAPSTTKCIDGGEHEIVEIKAPD